MLFPDFRRRERSLGRRSVSKPIIPAGVRAYAIGDVHGRDDLLNDLIRKISEDIAGRSKAKNHIVMLGDLIDRGPDSCKVIERLCRFAEPNVELHILSGNHEEVLLRILEGQSELIVSWLRFGGAETLRSYGVDANDVRRVDDEAGLRLIRSAIPADHQAFLRSLADTVRLGDYLFVHAGVRPRIDFLAQNQTDLRWIREPFLSDDGDHGFIVVHGHTVTDEVVDRPNRIGIDTGAYATGRLTALGLEAERRWFMESAGSPK